MAKGLAVTPRKPRLLSLLETLLHAFAVALLYGRLPALEGGLHNTLYATFAAVIALNAVAGLTGGTHSTLTGNFGRIASPLQLASVTVLGLCWGGLIPLFALLQLDSGTLPVGLPMSITVSALAVFTGSAFNSTLLLTFVLTALLPPVALLGSQGQYDTLLLYWLPPTLALLVMSRASRGLDQLIERFLHVARGNTDLVRHLAETRDEALAAKQQAEHARNAIQAEIAEREKAEEKIKSSERELTRILDDMIDTYFQVAPDGTLTRISPSVRQMLGYRPEDACRRTWNSLFVDDGDYGAFRSAMENSFGALQNYEVRLQHQQGHEVWVTLNAHYRENLQGRHEGLEGIARDTTEERRAKEKLFQEKELWRVTLRSIADGVITTDLDGRVSYLNPVAEHMTGWNNDQARQQPLTEVMQLFDETGDKAVQMPVKAWLEEGREASLSDPALLLRKDHQAESAIELSGSPIRDSGDQIIGSVMVFHDVTKLRSLAMQLSYQATHDALTGLINRVEFDARVEQAIHSANRTEKQHALCYVDLDQFKAVNDTCGHPAGDELLRQVTRLLRGALRESDVLARLGGDEFGILLLGCPLDKAGEIADKLRARVEAFRFRYDDKEFRIGASIGVVPIVDSNTPITEIMKAADSACYVAKDQGRNRVHVSRPNDKEVARHHGQMQWMQRIQQAVENDDLVLYAQPIVRLSDGSGRLEHAELLLRMVEDKGGENERIIPPSAFLPAAERYHLMPLIDRWVLKKALHRLADADDDIASLTTCTINLSGQSLTDMKLYDFVHKLLNDTGVDPGRICFEITESAVIANMQIAGKFVDGLRRKGCRFALDDFGSGLSTFDYLKQLNVDYVKLDGSLVRDVATSRVSQAMVHAINYVAHVMGMKSIAEYVENEAIVEALKKLSVDYAQGYAIGKPVRFLH